jgi:putative addiction module component (TIGR02574 family)
MDTHVAEILELSVAERLDIVGVIWDSIAADSDQLPIPDELKAELDRRSELYRNDPDAGVSWETLEKRLLNRG